MELVTKYQQRTIRRHNRIVKRYLQLRELHVGASQSMVASKVADEQHLTLEGVRKILISYGKWQSRTKSAQG